MKILSSPWTFPRIFRAVVGLAALIFGFVKHDSVMGLVGGLVLLMAITNTGCAGGSCSVPPRKEPPTNH